MPRLFKWTRVHLLVGDAVERGGDTVRVETSRTVESFERQYSDDDLRDVADNKHVTEALDAYYHATKIGPKMQRLAAMRVVFAVVSELRDK